MALFNRKETVLFLTAFCIQIGVFLFLFTWFVILGHLPQVAAQYPVYEGDSSSYFNISQNLLHHGAYSLSQSPPLVPDSFRLPGYPFFLYFFQLLGFPIVLIIFIQMMLGSGTVVLTYLLGKKFLSEKVASAAAFLLCIEPTSVFYSTFVMSDTIFVFLIMLAIYLLLTRRGNFNKDLAFLFTGGVALGLAILFRVIALYLPPFLIIAYIALYRDELRPFSKSIARAAVFMLGIVLIVAPWSIRNYAQFGVFDISATPYVNFTQFNLPTFYSYIHHVPLAEVYPIFSAPFASTSPWPAGSLANKAIFTKLIHDQLQGNYLNYLYFHTIKTLPFFVTDGVRDINRTVGLIPIPPDQTNFSNMVLSKDIAGILRYFVSPGPNLWMLLIGSTPWILISLLWLFELAYVLVKRPPVFWFVCIASCIILYFAFLTGPVTEHRYRMPAAPFMLLLAVQGAATLRELFKTKSGASGPAQSR